MILNRVASVFALASLVGAEVLLDPSSSGSSISSSSETGQKLLSKARLLNGERDDTWVAQYDIQYTGCTSLVQVRPEGGGNDEGVLYTQNLVKFSLCPSDSTSCRNGAEYVVNMMDFVDAYTENRLTEQEYICENIRENCYCNNGNDDEACANQCYQEQGMEVCIEYEGQDEFEIQEYLECKEMEEGNNNANWYYNNNDGNGNYNYNNNNNNANGQWGRQYFVGPYCSPKDGKSIHLGVFYDEGCSARADDSVYATRHYGMELPFMKESLVGKERISCIQVDNDNNNNNNNNQNQYYNNYNNGNNNNNNGNNNNNYNQYYQNYEVNELCAQVYEQAARCETNIKNSRYGADTSGCTYIHKILPRLEKAARSVARNAAAPGKVSGTFAWIFCMTTILFGGYSFFLYRKLARKAIVLDTGF